MMINTLSEKKLKGEKITMVTAYDYFSASIVDEAGIDIILVGDSLGMVVQAQSTTIPVTMDQMIYHTSIVRRVVKDSMVIGDMPFMSYHSSVSQAVDNAGRFLKEGGAGAVKLEGGRRMYDKIEAINNADIPVMAHIGLTPQSITKLGKFTVQGRSQEDKKRLIDDAKAVEAAGAFAVVLECVPVELAKEISEMLAIPTIGIGAGKYCDGQVLVFHDLLGLLDRNSKMAKFVKKYANLRQDAVKAIAQFKEETREGVFPSENESYH